MRTLRPVLALSAILGLFASNSSAQEKKPVAPAPVGTDSFDALNKEYREVVKAGTEEYFAAWTKAINEGKRKEFKFHKPFPAAMYSPRFLAIAERKPEGPDAIKALEMTLKTSTSDLPKPGTVLETRGKAIKILEDYYVTKPGIKGFLRPLASFDDADSKRLMADVIARNPDRKIKVAAYKEILLKREKAARFADLVKDPKRLAAIEKTQSKEAIKVQLANAEKAKLEIDGMKKILRTEFSNLYNDLAPGNMAPEIVSHNLDGSETKLSNLKGKVVVLDIWATWCGPCKAMISHEREMVERLKDKPFVLVSISADEKKETLSEFLKKEKMPWTHWWNGMDGGIVEDWDVRSFPTIYVIDAKGVIRYKNIRGEELEKSVRALLEEAKATQAKSPGIRDGITG